MLSHPAAGLVPILTVAEALGLPLVGRCTCCFNGQAHTAGRDRNPSLTFFPDSGRFKCFACGIRGDAIDLVRAVKGLAFRKAVEWLESLAVRAPVVTTSLATAKAAASTLGPDACAAYSRLYALCVPPKLDLSEGQYLVARGLDLGLAAAHHARVLADVSLPLGIDSGLLEAGGLVSRSGEFLFKHHRLLFFYFDDDRPVYVCARDVTGQSTAKELSPVGLPCPLPYNRNTLLNNAIDTLYLCEGCIDTLSAVQLGYPAIGVPGTCGFRREWISLLRGAKHVRVLFDNDESGRRQGAELAAQLRLQGIPAELFHPATGKDVNEHLLNLQKGSIS
jgi:DNA primase